VKLGVEMVSKHGRSVVQPTHVLAVANVQVMSQSQPPNQQWQEDVRTGVEMVSKRGRNDVQPQLAQVVANVPTTKNQLKHQHQPNLLVSARAGVKTETIHLRPTATGPNVQDAEPVRHKLYTLSVQNLTLLLLLRPLLYKGFDETIEDQ